MGLAAAVLIHTGRGSSPSQQKVLGPEADELGRRPPNTFEKVERKTMKSEAITGFISCSSHGETLLQVHT